MKIEKLSFDKKKNRLTFLWNDVEESYANTIRRIILEEVPTLAVEDVEIKENSSALYDEIIALRAGLCPIKTDLKTYELKEKCKCKGEGCARCELKLVLKGSKKGYVNATEAESSDPKCTFVYPMPIVKLLAKQKIEMQLTAVLNRGREHTKWSPGWAWYFGWPEFKVTSKSNLDALSKCGAIEIKGENIKIKDISKWNGAYEELCEKSNVEIVPNNTQLVFNLESWGQLSCDEILEKSSEILLEKLEELDKLL